MILVIFHPCLTFHPLSKYSLSSTNEIKLFCHVTKLWKNGNDIKLLPVSNKSSNLRYIFLEDVVQKHECIENC